MPDSATASSSTVSNTAPSSASSALPPASSSASIPLHELVIVGGGPAALTAALYASRAGLETIVYERGQIGGALAEISQIDNYPGFSGAGQALATAMRQQAASAGAQIEYGECTALQLAANLGHGNGFSTDGTSSPIPGEKASLPSAANFLLTVDAEPVAAQSVIIATGSAPRPLGFPLAVPVSYCALCDGVLAREKDVAVVGGGNSAFQESLYLAGLTRSLTLITHSAAKADAWLQDRLRRQPNVTIREHLEPTPDLLNQFDHVFVYIGKQPATAMLRRLASPSQPNPQNMPSEPDNHELSLKLLDAQGYILAPATQTALPGLFAAGDVRAQSVKQVVSAAADGAAAALAAYDFLHGLAPQ